ncbi:subclass B3 metallo-beta-lactamase [Sapientia aquatica]|uniref:Subclass B3 metallo-beta-lactamase n=1 Tax=Sapientia aquatica TaxID=1549640 RepID=A0A4R5VYD6_9BURK|nr:subclass B3 metallo-beta-lactamase [Sapientia aquatica]TDK63461.1 subclass B3 metallo-beta-lactamase [Sapientia aquatica]
MKKLFGLFLLLSGITVNALADSEAINCGACASWNQQQKPFNVYGNTWYVGPKGLSSILITSPQGHILLDGALPQSAKLIQAHIRALGFRVEDIKLIVNSHAHFDHAGGIAALQKASGATVAASASGAAVLIAGTVDADDPQFDPKNPFHVPKVDKVQIVQDGESLHVGDLVITAHTTPGHTPGSTAWTWKSCEKERCLNVVYADSLNPISSDGFNFLGDAQHTDVAPLFKESIAKVAGLPCDILLAPHPGMVDTFEKQATKTAKLNPFIDPNACRAYAENASERLEERLAKERLNTAVTKK